MASACSVQVGAQLKTGNRSTSIFATSLEGIATAPSDVAMIVQKTKATAKAKIATMDLRRRSSDFKADSLLVKGIGVISNFCPLLK
jgi:hypothetical protein